MIKLKMKSQPERDLQADLIFQVLEGTAKLVEKIIKEKRLTSMNLKTHSIIKMIFRKY